MKRIFSFFAIIGIFFASNCSRIPENNDPVIGIWSIEAKASTSEAKSQASKQEWIFNDAYLGRYHSYLNNELNVQTDFKWSQEDGVYTISYPGIDLPNNIVSMKTVPEGTVLEDNNGNVLAMRE